MKQVQLIRGSHDLSVLDGLTELEIKQYLLLKKKRDKALKAAKLAGKSPREIQIILATFDNKHNKGE